MPLADISDTALWVAMYRAMETARRDALFRDPYAARLAGDRGREIVRRLPAASTFAAPMIVRTWVFDEIIMRLVNAGVDTVLNLAAGLDARQYRLPLPPSLHWVEVDLRSMIEHKRAVLAGERPVCRAESVALDLREREARRELFARVGAAAREVLIVTEGLLIYLKPDDVGALADDLAAQPSFRWWLIDLASPLLLEFMRRRTGPTLRAANAPMQFAPAEGPAFFEPHGWKVAEWRSSFDESHRLRREFRGAWLWRLLRPLVPKRRWEAFRRMAAFVLLERS
jgi:methyltransferase (TIGR00027 family)